MSGLSITRIYTGLDPYNPTKTIQRRIKKHKVNEYSCVLLYIRKCEMQTGSKIRKTALMRRTIPRVQLYVNRGAIIQTMLNAPYQNICRPHHEIKCRFLLNHQSPRWTHSCLITKVAPYPQQCRYTRMREQPASEVFVMLQSKNKNASEEVSKITHSKFRRSTVRVRSFLALYSLHNNLYYYG